MIHNLYLNESPGVTFTHHRLDQDTFYFTARPKRSQHLLIIVSIYCTQTPWVEFRFVIN